MRMPTSLAGIKGSDLQEGLDFQIVLRKTYDGSRSYRFSQLCNLNRTKKQTNKQKEKKTTTTLLV